MTERRYAESHEWVTVAGDMATIGISEHAVEQLGDVVYLDLPAPGQQLKRGDVVGDIESVKAVSQIYSPVAGELVEVNPSLRLGPSWSTHLRSTRDGSQECGFRRLRTLVAL